MSGDLSSVTKKITDRVKKPRKIKFFKFDRISEPEQGGAFGVSIIVDLKGMLTPGLMVMVWNYMFAVGVFKND